MPIILEMKFKRSRPERFVITLADETQYIIAPETALKYQLAPGVEIPEATFAALLAEDEIQRAKDQALRYLEIRPHSERELIRKLQQKRYNPPAIKAAIEALKKVDLINDERFARQYLETEMLLRPAGKRLLLQKLRERGIPDTISTGLLEEIFETHSENEIARQLTAKFLKRHAHKSAEKRKAALVRFLKSKGFSWEIIQEILESEPLT